MAYVEITGFAISIASLPLSVYFYWAANRASRTLETTARRIEASVTEVDRTLEQYRQELATARQATSIRTFCLQRIQEAAAGGRTLTVTQLEQAASELNPFPDEWEVRAALRDLHARGHIRFDPPLGGGTSLLP